MRTATSTSAPPSTRSSRTSSSRASSLPASTRRTCRAGIATACRSRCRSRRPTASTCRRPNTQRLCRAYAAEQIERQKADFQRLGVLGDWDHPYTTMGYRNEADEIRMLGRLLEKGYLYRGLKPVNWCFDCQSALAEAEVEYEERQDTAIDVGFPLTDAPSAQSLRTRSGWRPAPEGAIAAVIWTTTPWTIPANQALNVHPDLDYALVAHRRAVICCWPRTSSRAAWSATGSRGRSIATAKGSGARAAILFRHPFYDRVAPVYLGDYVTLEQGTGIVHSAPAYGIDDFDSCHRYGMKDDAILNPVQGDGRYAESLPFFGGMNIWEANPQIVAKLREVGRAARRGTLDAQLHALLAAQDADHLSRDHAMVRRHGRGSRLARRQARRDRCARRRCAASRRTRVLSRLGQGAPRRHDRQPARLDAVAAAPVGRAAAVLRRQGNRRAAPGHARRCWSSPRPRSSMAASRPGSRRRTKTSASMPRNTASSPTRWTSGSIPARRMRRCCRSRPASWAFPADLYLEGSDQHRGWFHSSLLTSSMLNGAPPYEALLTHGFAVDGDGKKMSKSKGNVVAPQKVCDTLGAEILRLWVAATDYSGELSISDEILKRVVESYRRIRNTLRFLLANTADFDPAQRCGRVPGALRARSLRARRRQARLRELRRGLRALRVSPGRAAAADLLLGGPRRLLSRHPQGPALHGGRDQPRAALGANGAGADPRRCSSSWRRCCASPPRRRGGRPPARRRRSSCTPGTTHSRARHHAAPSPTNGRASAPCRAEVQKKLEAAREAGAIGSSLQAEVDDRRAGGGLRGAREPRRRPALRAHHLRGEGHAGAQRAGARGRRARTRSASAAGTIAPTSAPTRAHPESVRAAASPTCSAPASRARSREAASTADG